MAGKGNALRLEGGHLNNDSFYRANKFGLLFMDRVWFFV